MDSLALGFDTRSSLRVILGAAQSSPPTGPEFRSTTTCEPSEPQTFDWQMSSTKDTSWKGKSRSWIEDKPGRARALSACKTLAVWIPPITESYERRVDPTVTQGRKGSEAPPLDSHHAQALSENQRGELLPTDVAHQITAGGGKPGQGYPAVLISSVEDSPAKTSPSPDEEPDLKQANDPDSSSSSHESSTLFDPDSFSSRTFQVSSLHRAVGTSDACLERWPTSGMAWLGGLSTAVSSECRSDADGCSSSEPSLSEILEPPQNVPGKYSLSARAASGILRRAEKRGRTLPSHLSAALETVARTTTTDKQGG